MASTMNTVHKQFQEAFAELNTITMPEKIVFLEVLLFQFTITGRGIWSDDQPSDLEKVEAFKWLNELSHRIWNMRSDLQRGEKDDSIVRLYGNMKYYAEQSNLLGSHLVPAVISAFENFKQARDTP